MKKKTYWANRSPWVVMSMVMLSIPFIVLYMWIFHPRLCWQQLKEVWQNRSLY